MYSWRVLFQNVFLLIIDDLCQQSPLVEADFHVVTRLDGFRGADNPSFRRQTNRIAPFQNRQRTERIQSMSETGESLMPFFQPLVNGRRQSLFA
jgi:hypothetical protein